MTNFYSLKKLIVLILFLLLFHVWAASETSDAQVLPTKVLFLEGNSWISEEDHKIKNILWQMGFTHDSIRVDRPFEITSQFLHQYGLIIWPDGNIASNYMSTEKIERIASFVSNGGNLFIGVPQLPDNVNRLIELFGIRHNGDFSRVDFKYKSCSHPISAGIYSHLYWFRNEPGVGVEGAYVLAIRHPATSIIWVHGYDPSGYTLLAAAEYGKGRVVVMAGLHMMRMLLMYDYMGRGDTKQLLINIINWLGRKGT